MFFIVTASRKIDQNQKFINNQIIFHHMRHTSLGFQMNQNHAVALLTCFNKLSELNPTKAFQNVVIFFMKPVLH